jgi:hypothetical protein
MNVWRLIPHHIDPFAFADWSRSKGALAIGWGQMGDLRQCDTHNEAEMKRLVAEAHPDYSPGSKANGGRSLWRFYHEMQVGDLVIISASGSRKQTMRVTGYYYFVKLGDDPSHYYEHRRKAEVVPIDPNRLWQAVGRVASGEGVYSTLVRCTRSLTEAEADALTG